MSTTRHLEVPNTPAGFRELVRRCGATTTRATLHRWLGLGSPNRAIAWRLWRALLETYCAGTCYFTAGWHAFGGAFYGRAHDAHPKGSGQTSFMEAIN